MLFAIPVFTLSACSAIVCLTGLCPSIKEHMAKIPWNPPSLEHQNCPDINGKYSARIHVTGLIYSELFMEFPLGDDKDSFIHATTEETPEGAKFYSATGIKDYILIEKKERNLMVSRIGPDGNLFQRTTIGLNSPAMGCADGYFIIRTISPPFLGEWGYGTVSAIEKKIKKRADGSLEITRYTREWQYNDMSGLIGMNPDGSKNSTGMPMEWKPYTMVFPSAP
jgi:hypothetical protein